MEPLDRHLDVHLRAARRAAARPVRSSRRRTSVGSSSARRRSDAAALSSSPFAFGVTAKLITGSGNVDRRQLDRRARRRAGDRRSASPSASRRRRCRPRRTPCRPCAPSPGASSSWPSRSFACARDVRDASSRPSRVPWRTRKSEMRPANGSAIVLKTKAAVPAPSTVDRRAALAPATARPRRAGRAAPSCRGSSSRRPHATGKISPRVTASLSACATSSTPSSSPSR